MGKKVIIIGAGPAGLAAAYEILKTTDMKPIILEGSSVIGGISQTVSYKGNRIDIGGHRFFSKNKEIMNLWKEIMPLQGALSSDDILLDRKITLEEDGPNPNEEDVVMLTRNRVSRILYLMKFFDYPISLKPATFKNMGLRRTFVAGVGYMKSALFKRPENTLEDFMINRFGKPLYQMFFEKYTEKVWGRNPKYISADWGAQRIKGLSLKKAVWNVIAKPFRRKNAEVETSLIEQFWYPKKGPGQLYEVLADKIVEMGGEIKFNCRVDKICLSNQQIVCVMCQGQTYEADYFISTMPIKDLYEAMGEENVPNSVYEVAHNLVYRDFITVGLLLNKLKLKNKTKIKTVNDIVPDTWIYIQEDNVKLGRLQIFNNWSPYMVEDSQNVWIGLEYFCNEGDELWEMGKEEFIEMAINELVKIKVIDREDVLDYTQIKIKKAYPAYFDVYERMNEVKEHLNTIDNLYCVGRNGQHRYNNMDHSMMTAITAVRSIVDPLNYPKKSIWDINTESDYHETNKKDN